MSSLTPQQRAEYEQFKAWQAMQAEATKDATTAKVLADAPAPRTQVKRATATTAKVATVVPDRDLQAYTVSGPKGTVRKYASGAPVPGSGVVFTVAPVTGDGKLATRGARVRAFEDGKPMMRATMSEALLTALDPVGKSPTITQLRAVIAKVDKDALIGAHRPAKPDPAAEPVAEVADEGAEVTL